MERLLEFYVTVSLDNGVFALVDGDWVEPRMSRVFAIPPSTGYSNPAGAAEVDGRVLEGCA